MAPDPIALQISLPELLGLPVSGEARTALWRLALAQGLLREPEQRWPLHLALARSCGQAATSAAADGQWQLVASELPEALGQYQQLLQLDPAKAAQVRQEGGGLLLKLISDAHGAVLADEPLEPLPRAQLCWQAAGWLRQWQRLELEAPEWLAPVEEQVLREGLIGLRQLQDTQEFDGEGPWHQQALELALRLARLHQPTPEWIALAAKEELGALLELADLEDPATLRQLLVWLTRLPLAPEAQAAVQLAAQRGVAALELLANSSERQQAVAQAAQPVAAPQPQTPPAAAPVPEPAAAPPVDAAPLQLAAAKPAAPQPRPAEPINSFDDMVMALRLGLEQWLADHPAGSGQWRLQPLLRPGERLWLHNEQVLALNLAPLLAFPAREQLDQLLPLPFALLKQRGHQADLALAEPTAGLWQELTCLWGQGERFSIEQLQALVYVTSLWERCGGAEILQARPMGLEALPAAALTPGCCIVRPGNVEMAALQSALLQKPQLEDWLAEIRRRHHDRAWMEQRREEWWVEPRDGCENLKRLHTNAGFYASAHAPAESLRCWSQATLRALMADQVLFGNEGINQMLWPVAQVLQARSGQPLKLRRWAGEQAFYDFIAGQELVFITPLVRDVEQQHRSGNSFRLFKDLQIQPYGLRCLEAPMSVYPNRPARGFEDSLARCLDQIDRLYRQKPFAVFTAAAGAYGLPLCEAVHQRYGVSCIYIGNQMHALLGVLQNTSVAWRAEQRIEEHWLISDALNGIPGVDRIEDGRYLG